MLLKSLYISGNQNLMIFFFLISSYNRSHYIILFFKLYVSVIYSVKCVHSVITSDLPLDDSEECNNDGWNISAA